MVKKIILSCLVLSSPLCAMEADELEDSKKNGPPVLQMQHEREEQQSEETDDSMYQAFKYNCPSCECPSPDQWLCCGILLGVVGMAYVKHIVGEKDQ